MGICVPWWKLGGERVLFRRHAEPTRVLRLGYQINAGEDTPGFGTHPAGVKNRPNKFGLHDMHGNVYCWCADWYDSAYYSKSPAVDPPGSAAGADLGDGTGPLRVIRGGSYRSDQQACRAAYRGSFPSENRYSTIGFRVVVKP